MRNQGWTQEGELIKDNELYLDSGVLMVRDISGKVREPTDEETEQFYSEPVMDYKAEILKLQDEVKKIKEK